MRPGGLVILNRCLVKQGCVMAWKKLIHDREGQPGLLKGQRAIDRLLEVPVLGGAVNSTLSFVWCVLNEGVSTAVYLSG